MKQPACVIEFTEGQQQMVTGTLDEVQAALDAGGLVRLSDPWGREVTVNTATVSTVQALPGGVGEDD